MGMDPVSWAAIGSAVLGATASYANTQSVNRKQDRALADGIRSQSKRNQQAEALVREALGKQGASDPEVERAAATDKYLTQIRRTSGNATAGLDQKGGVSDRYLEQSADAVGDVAATSEGAARLMAAIDAPLRQRQNEGIAFGRLGGDLNLVSEGANSDRYLSDIRLRSIQRDPWLDALAVAASAYSSSYSPSTGGVGTSAAYTPTQYGGTAVYGTAGLNSGFRTA